MRFTERGRARQGTTSANIIRKKARSTRARLGRK